MNYDTSPFYFNQELLPLNCTLHLIFRELAIVGDIYRGQHKHRTPPWQSATYKIYSTKNQLILSLNKDKQQQPLYI